MTMFISEALLSETHTLIRPHIRRTPLMESPFWQAITGAASFHFKCEQFQTGGAFKFRGATNALLRFSEEEKKAGVITHSSGNHAAALAIAAKRHNVKATIIMPDNSPRLKVRNVRRAGASIIFCEPTLAARESTLAEVQSRKGSIFIPPYNHLHIIAGQATAALEIYDDIVPDVLVVPVGGGGLAAGTAMAAYHRTGGNTLVIAAEPRQADDAYHSLKQGKIVPAQPQTIADGLRTSLGELTFAVLQKHLNAVLTVEEIHIVCAMRALWENDKLLVEPSAATALAAVMAYPHIFKGKKVAVILSGGNVDLHKLPWQKKSGTIFDGEVK